MIQSVQLALGVRVEYADVLRVAQEKKLLDEQEPTEPKGASRKRRHEGQPEITEEQFDALFVLPEWGGYCRDYADPEKPFDALLELVVTRVRAEMPPAARDYWLCIARPPTTPSDVASLVSDGHEMAAFRKAHALFTGKDSSKIEPQFMALFSGD